MCVWAQDTVCGESPGVVCVPGTVCADSPGVCVCVGAEQCVPIARGVWSPWATHQDQERLAAASFSPRPRAAAAPAGECNAPCCNAPYCGTGQQPPPTPCTASCAAPTRAPAAHLAGVERLAAVHEARLAPRQLQQALPQRARVPGRPHVPHRAGAAVPAAARAGGQAVTSRADGVMGNGRHLGRGGARRPHHHHPTAPRTHTHPPPFLPDPWPHLPPRAAG